MARAAKTSTVVLLVRHGQTATTGRLLPGRAPGLHLSDDGRRQAEAAAFGLLSGPVTLSSTWVSVGRTTAVRVTVYV